MDDFLDPQDRQTQNAEAQKKAQLFDRQLRESFAALTSTPEGLLFTRWLVDQTGILKSQFCDDYAKASFYEGRRSIGAKILNMAAQAGKLSAILEGNNNGN